jgi:isopentenyl-diphosphate delta-isomerase
MKEESVILVNENDETLGQMEKMEVHRKGLLHRAFSIFIFDEAGKMLLQQRAAVKYHGALLWTNTCCSHPFPGEEVKQAAFRRLKEEMGFKAPLRHLFSFTYRAEVENGLIEHELDHVFAGIYEGKIFPDPTEVADFRYESMDSLEKEMLDEPEKFTTWFRIAWPKIREWWSEAFGKNGASKNLV